MNPFERRLIAALGSLCLILSLFTAYLHFTHSVDLRIIRPVEAPHEN